jgi:hypothetical protein
MANQAHCHHYFRINTIQANHLCDTEHLCGSYGEVEGWRYKLVVPGLVGAGEVVGRAAMSSQRTFFITTPKGN